MNKFVKGAKNLAFALSFVTVAACGKGKEIEDLKNQIETCKKDANNAQTSVDSLKKTVEGCVKTEEIVSVKNDIDGLKKKSGEIVDLIKGGDVKSLSDIFGDKVGGIVDCSKYKISVGATADTGKKVVVKIENDGKEVVADVFGGSALDSVENFDSCLVYLGNIVKGKGRVELKSGDVFAGDTNSVKFGGATGIDAVFVRICKLLNVLGVKADQCGLDNVFAENNVWGVAGSNFGLSCKVFVEGLNAFVGKEVCKVKDPSSSGGDEKIVVLLEDVFGGKKNTEIAIKKA